MSSNSSPVSQHQASNAQDSFGPQDIDSNVSSDSSPANQHQVVVALPHRSHPAVQAVITELINNGVDSAASRAAAIHASSIAHRDLSITAEVLVARLNDVVSNLGQQNYDRSHQNTPNAIALRLLAPPPGPSYDYEQPVTLVLFLSIPA
ncbi:hypothetical protein J7T55_000795 [Diaporthe amygdali]|uniref:uncharacterized protein n=1 Tax=Phomopsis amygdali TaxID=1214568 RepID=UPI0022FDBA15|nr:uncharacterized protein J7T55_000795 [Diaporthe amygdali]KAJ0119945.1 hypothetical protein J7T55_000795 [Diaporthe amygdali]